MTCAVCGKETILVAQVPFAPVKGEPYVTQRRIPLCLSCGEELARFLPPYGESPAGSTG